MCDALLVLCRIPTLTSLADKVAQANPFLSASAQQFALNPEADDLSSNSSFTRAFAHALATNASFAAVVADDPAMSKAVLDSIPGQDVPALCPELAENAAQGAQQAAVYECFCNRNAASPPLVACTGMMADMTLASMTAAEEAGINSEDNSDAAAEEIGRRLRQFVEASNGQGGMAWPGASRARRTLRQTPSRSSLTSSGGLCKATEMQKEFQVLASVANKFGLAKAARCEVQLRIPTRNQVCDAKEAGRAIYAVGSDFITGADMQASAVRQFLEASAFGLDAECCIPVKIMDVCLTVGFSVPTFFTMIGPQQYLMCNAIQRVLPESADNTLAVALGADNCLNLAAANPTVLSELGEYVTG